MTTTFSNIKVNENVKTSEYRLMYFFGVWFTREVIYAENDAEAIFDSDDSYKASGLEKWQYSVALWCGNRMVKSYKDNLYNFHQ